MAVDSLTNHLWLRFSGLLLLVGLHLSLAGCSPEPAASEPIRTEEPGRPPLRVITLRRPEGVEFLPRSGLPESVERDVVRAYAESEGREVEFVPVEGLEELFTALHEGKGDLAAANLTVTESRSEVVAFTTPLAFAREVVIARKGERFENAHGLGGRKIAVHDGSSFQETLESIKRQRFQPPFEIVALPPGLPDEAVLDGVADGSYELTVLDSNSANALLPGREELQVALSLSNVRPIAWAVRPTEGAFLASLNKYLSEHHLLQPSDERYLDDLNAIKERGVLRMATRNNAANYFLWRGELLGFEYELLKRFAESQGLRLAVVVPPGHDALPDWVREGRADLAAASLTITDERQDNGLAFSRPYNSASELLVTRADDPVLQTLEDLAGRTVVVRRNSSYWKTLESLRAEGAQFVLEAAPEDLETEQIIDRVARGEYDLTVADSHIVDIEMTWRDDIRSAFALGDSRPHGWLLRASNPKLREALDSFIKKEFRGLFYNVTHKKYFGDPKRVRARLEQRADGGAEGVLSPYDALVQDYATRYGLDWRLVVSQMYQESRFDPKAKSWAGALGLMQVLPRTAKELGLSDLHDPEVGLHAGVKYLDWLMKRFEPELNMAERTWFALAAYNAGIGHVRDARRLAARKGWDADRWFGNVERAMLLLSEREYARQAAHGYVRGREPVDYVRQIRDRFEAYVRLSAS